MRLSGSKRPTFRKTGCCFDAKVTAAEFVRALTLLKEAGFRKNQVGAYLLRWDLPGRVAWNHWRIRSGASERVDYALGGSILRFRRRRPRESGAGKLALSRLAADPIYNYKCLRPRIPGSLFP